MGQVTYTNPMGNSTQPIQVNVTQQKNPYDFSDAMVKGAQAGAATAQAGAAAAQAAAARNANYTEAMKDNYSKISVDNLINNTYNYDYVVVEGISGYNPKVNKEEVLQILNNAKKYLIFDISPDYRENGDEIENNKNLRDNLKNSPKALFINWQREAQGDYIRITKLTIKNFEGKVIYESISKNLSHQEILNPLISNYIFTKEMAFSKIEEFKKYLDLGIISKEEYDIKVSELKPILLGDK